MAKKASSLSKKYLRILGWIDIVLSIISIIVVVSAIALQVDVNVFADADTLSRLRAAEMSDDIIRAALCGTYVLACLFNILIGWLLIRAANDPKKTTLILVLTIADLITGIVSLVSSGFSTPGAALNGIVSLTLSVLTLMALLRVRREVDA